MVDGRLVSHTRAEIRARRLADSGRHFVEARQRTRTVMAAGMATRATRSPRQGSRAPSADALVIAEAVATAKLQRREAIALEALECQQHAERTEVGDELGHALYGAAQVALESLAAAAGHLGCREQDLMQQLLRMREVFDATQCG